MQNLLAGKTGVVFGVANQRSIAWAVAEKANEHGANVIIGVQNERTHEAASKLIEGKTNFSLVTVDLNDDDQLTEVAAGLPNLDFAVHSVASAAREDLSGRIIDTSRAGFNMAIETSAFTFVAMAKALEKKLNSDASIITMSYLGSQRVLPGYNIMGVAKAALEACARYLAHNLGEQGVRVNVISPGPINTVSARGIKGFTDILNSVGDRAPLKRPATQEQVALTSLYLLSDLSFGVTGQIIYVDSGYSIMGL